MRVNNGSLMQHLWHFINLTLLCTQPSTPSMYIYLLVYTGLYWILKYKLSSAQVVWSEWGRSDTEGRDAGCGPGCKLIFKTPCHGIVNLHVFFPLLFSKDRWVTCNFFTISAVFIWQSQSNKTKQPEECNDRPWCQSLCCVILDTAFCGLQG